MRRLMVTVARQTNRMILEVLSGGEARLDAIDIQTAQNSLDQLTKISAAFAPFGNRGRGGPKWARDLLGDLSDIGRETDVLVARELDKSLGVPVSKLTPSMGQHVEAWVDTNVALIKSIPTQAVEKVREALLSGDDVEAMAKRIQEIAGITERRARLIARDQVAKLESKINAERQKVVGIEKYEWRSRRDERVREQHRKQDGQVYSWDDPPPGGHPGEPVNCRCVAQAILPDADDEGEISIPAVLTPPTPVQAAEKALAESTISFLQSGMRSLSPFRAALRGRTPAQINRITTELTVAPFDQPMKIEVTPDGVELVDGRHRLQAAREAGAERIAAEISTYDKAGNLVSREVTTVATGGNVFTLVEGPQGRRLVRSR